MKTDINKHRLREFTRHIILAEKKHIKKEEESGGQELFIKRSFPGYPSGARIIGEKPSPQIQMIEKPKIIKERPSPQIQMIEKPQITGEKPEGIFEVGKLTKFILDKMIDSIECSGPNNPIKIKKESYIFQTDIILKEDEILDVIKIFSKESKVPVSPVFRTETRGFSIIAIISSTGSRFLISRKK